MRLQVAIRHAFDGFELDIAFDAGPGVTALFGRSGAGKTTIVIAVAGLLRPDQAQITLGQTTFDSDSTHLPPHQRRIGYVFQDARLFPHLSVAQNLDYATRFGARAQDRDQIIAMLGLGDLLDRAPATLSGGQKQRVALGRALLSDPQLLLMDEPLAALDAPRKAEILPYLERLKADSAVPILYVSHALEEVARLADEIVVLAAGRIRTHGPVFDVMAEPELVPLFGVREAGAVLRATVAERAADGLTRVTTSAGDIHLMGVHAAPGATIRLRVLAQDVMLSRTHPQGLSALNILPVRIAHIFKGDGPGVAVRLRAGDDHLLARITARAMTQLNLNEGEDCFAILKASSVAPIAISGAQTAQI